MSENVGEYQRYGIRIFLNEVGGVAIMTPRPDDEGYTYDAFIAIDREDIHWAIRSLIALEKELIEEEKEAESSGLSVPLLREANAAVETLRKIQSEEDSDA